MCYYKNEQHLCVQTKWVSLDSSKRCIAFQRHMNLVVFNFLYNIHTPNLHMQILLAKYRDAVFARHKTENCNYEGRKVRASFLAGCSHANFLFFGTSRYIKEMYKLHREERKEELTLWGYTASSALRRPFFRILWRGRTAEAAFPWGS